jgi:hypothetical protein
MHKAGIIPSLLAQITSSELREVAVDMQSHAMERLKEVDWDSIVRVLQQPNFSELEKFTILGVDKDHTGASNVPTARNYLMERLPAGRARNKLIIHEMLWIGGTRY